MKKLFLIYLFFQVFSGFVFSQNAWTELNAVIANQPASEIPTLRGAATGFASGTGIYYCTGNRADYLYTDNLHDLWKFDVTTNTWSQKAQLTNTGRSNAYSFVVNGSPFVLMGLNDTIFKRDLWKYDITADTWTQFASFPGAPRFGAVTFCINNKFYFGGGKDFNSYYQDFWEYDPINNLWTRKSDLQMKLYSGQGFTTSSYGYLVGAFHSVTIINSTLRYNPAIDVWDNVSVCPAQNYMGAFSVNDSGYVFSVWVMYKYDETADVWITKDSMDVRFVSSPTIAELNGLEYFITYDNDVWSYDPLNDIWDKKFKAPKSEVSQTSLVLNDTAYFNTYKYSILDDRWIQDSLLYDLRLITTIDSFGYGQKYNTGEFKKIDPLTRVITDLAPIPFQAILSGFEIQGEGYFFGENYDTSGYPFYEFWKYSPDSDMWSRKADFPSVYNSGVAAFGLGDYGYFVGGMDMTAVPCAQFYRYQPSNDSWTEMDDYPPGTIVGARAQTFNGKGVIAFGTIYQLGATLNEIFEYDPLTEAWSQIYNTLTSRRSYGIFFSYENNIYLGGGSYKKSQGFEFPLFDFWKYTETRVGVEEIENESKTPFVYPNPVHSVLKINGEDFLDEVEIFDALGNLLLKSKLPVDVSALSNGMYLIRSNDNRLKEKFTVIH